MLTRLAKKRLETNRTPACRSNPPQRSPTTASTPDSDSEPISPTYNDEQAPQRDKTKLSLEKHHPTRRHFKVATLNIRSLGTGKAEQIAAACDKYGIEIIALQEHKKKTSSELEFTNVDHGLLVKASANERGQGGVALFFNKKAKETLQSVTKISERIILAHLDGNPMLSVISAYAPTELASTSDKEQFYAQLEDVIHSLPPHNVLLVDADFNARLGPTSSSKGIIGTHLYHEETNENGELLTALCGSCGLSEAQSRFPHRKGRLWTWRHPNPATRPAQLDHILIGKKWVNSLRNCRAYNTASLESDHRMVSASVRLSLRSSVAKQPRRPRIDWKRLLEAGVSEKFELELRNRYETLDDHSQLQTRYDKLLNCVEEAAIQAVGVIPPAKSNPWISKSTAALIEQREKAKMELECYVAGKRANTKKGSLLRNNYRKLVEKTRFALAADEVAQLEKQLEQMKEAARKNEPNKTWQLIRRITGQEKRPPTKVKSSKNHSGAVTEKEMLDEWRTYFQDLLNAKRPADVNTSLEPTREHLHQSLPIRTEAFSQDEISEAIKTLKNNKAPGTDAILTAELFKNGGDYLASVLRSICSEILNGSDPPWQWVTNRIVPIPKKSDTSLMTNYRGISLMSVAAKVYFSIVDCFSIVSDRTLTQYYDATRPASDEEKARLAKSAHSVDSSGGLRTRKSR